MNTSDSFMRVTNDVSDQDLLKEINQVAANLSCFDTSPFGPMKGTDFMDSYVNGVRFPDTTHIDADMLNRARMIALHPQRYFRHPRAIKLEADARIALQRAEIALGRGNRSRAEELLATARRLIAQSNDTRTIDAVPPALEARQRAGGKATADKRRTLKAKIDEHVAEMIRQVSPTTKHLESHSKLADALKTQLAHFLYDQKEALDLPNAIRAKVLMEVCEGWSHARPSAGAERYAYGQIIVLLGKPAHGTTPSLTRQAFEEMVAAHRGATTESDALPSTSSTS